MSQRKPEVCAPPQHQPLYVLPVFFDLRGRTVLFAGCGEGAQWKLELILSAGATVTWVSKTIDDDMRALTQSVHESLHYSSRPWNERDFQNKTMAIGAFDDRKEAEAFAQTARNASVPVNLIDKKDLCDFQFGSIINRSPVVVSVSTSGTSPALAQAIRSRIEALLPQGIGEWAWAAKVLREAIKQRIPNGSERRRAWQAFAHAAFTEPVDKASEFFKTLHHNPQRSGHVTLVGAGPGAGDLLTLRAVRAMQAADVILFDDLIADEVLDLARRDAKRMLVGKRGHRASCQQDDINALMIDLAKKGKRVVRLKSGDPMIFGRAGEEIATLEEEGIRVETVPGVTAALAAASSLGVSLTHRDCAQGVTLLTAHSKKGVLPDLNWQSHADPAKTLMIYMGGRTAGTLAEKLTTAGLPMTTPVVVMESLSRQEERFVSMTLGELSAHTIQAEGPVLLGIGQVFAAAKVHVGETPAISAA